VGNDISMIEKTITWIDYLIAISSVITPMLILVLIGVGWKIKTKINRNFELEDKLREDRIEIYNYILEPFIIMLMSEDAWKTENKNKNKDKFKIATKKMLSLEYRKKSFRLSLMGSDSVVKAFNDLFQHIYSYSEEVEHISEEVKTKEMMRLLGGFLLGIRKSMGNESTKLDEWQMLEWFITDARKYRKDFKR